MRIVTRRRLPGPIDRGGSEYTISVIETKRIVKKCRKCSIVKKNEQFGNKFFFLFSSNALNQLLAFTPSGNSSTVTSYVRRGCRVKRKCKWVNGEVQVRKKKVRK